MQLLKIALTLALLGPFFNNLKVDKMLDPMRYDNSDVSFRSASGSPKLTFDTELLKMLA
jgi:hypothetical protein